MGREDNVECLNLKKWDLRALSALPVSRQIDKRNGGDQTSIQPINLDCINIKSNKNRKSHYGDGLPLLLGLMCGALAYLAASSFRAVTIADMPTASDAGRNEVDDSQGCTRCYNQGKNVLSKRVHAAQVCVQAASQKVYLLRVRLKSVRWTLAHPSGVSRWSARLVETVMAKRHASRMRYP
jgi:hypothetical protein